ncbi:2-C-methyl-D-erythritol 4-phosphate cytidylyltransferase [Brachybacterium sp. FME24]|uniref:IspD/TarI family cytidylyltransferase n=1 Tax=Brachybacterium sp. FME24 TaxID=2742605 RepID=UPI001869327E|nr:2-C-methyl-D-erythritol 4-phosphate cytidylyltransferase [Brachybacterium sp. FME24]
MSSPSASPTTTAVRPVVLALAPPAPGVSHGSTTPCLEMLGGARLIEHLLDTLAAAGLPSPLVVSGHDSVPALRRVLRERAHVLGTDGGRRNALSAAVAATTEEALLVHDAERALTPVSVVTEVLAALDVEADAALPVIALTDSVKAVHDQGLRNIDRSTVVGMQSPRLLRRATLEAALAQPRTAGIEAERGMSKAALTADRRLLAENAPERFDEILSALSTGAQVRTVHGSHAGFAVRDRLSLWQAQISRGLARDTSHRHGLSRRT